MSVAVIYNGFGSYEQNEQLQKGITLQYAGHDFWLPYKEVTYIPDFSFREPDHKAMAELGEDGEGVVIYKTVNVRGDRIAAELLNRDQPTPNKEKGIVQIHSGRPTGAYKKVLAGFNEGGEVLTNDVMEIVPAEAELAEAHRIAQNYKEQTIQEYFQSKRERMSGGQGRLFPTGLIRTFMAELGIKDIDDVTRQMEASKSPALQSIPADLKAQLLEELRRELFGKAVTAPVEKTEPDLSDLV